MIVESMKYIFKKIIIAGIFICLGFNQLTAATTIRIAILDFDANGTSKYVANAVSEVISTEMSKKKELAVIERKKLVQF